MLTRSLFTLAALSLFAVSAIAQDVPAKLVPPQEGPLVGKYAAKGVQIYVCNVKGGVGEWGFKAPEAELIDAQGRSFAKHYAGPTWEAPDGSKIVGKILASESARPASVRRPEQSGVSITQLTTSFTSDEVRPGQTVDRRLSRRGRKAEPRAATRQPSHGVQ